MNANVFVLILNIAIFCAGFVPPAGAEPRFPNIVFIFLDDAGYGDFSPFNTELAYETPHVERLANQGTVFRNFYVSQSICSASRASLLTGSYPGRTGVFGALAPQESGLDPSFTVLPEYLKVAGYNSAIVGKWHLGDQDDTRPHVRGFDFSSGLMYSNDMWENHPTNPELWSQYPLQYWRNGYCMDESVGVDDQKILTRRYTREAVRFVEENADTPFFLYLAHSMPHVPLYCSDAFAGKSGAGLYGDVIMELDWSVGQVMGALEATGVSQNTMVIFTTDNGPWLLYGEHSGQTPFREGKRTSFEGGVRSGCIIKYPRRVEAGIECDRTFLSIDLVPTILKHIGVEFDERALDGRDVWPIVAGQSAVPNPHRYYAFSIRDRLEAILSSDGRWKLHLEHSYLTVVEPGQNAYPGKNEKRIQALALYDLMEDPLETRDLLDVYPDTASLLQAFAAEHIEKFPLLRR